MKDLHVKIRKRHEPLLRKRWKFSRIKNGEEDSCSLCDVYDDFVNLDNHCKGCPFHKYEDRYSVGCFDWMQRVTKLPTVDEGTGLSIAGGMLWLKDREKAKIFIARLKRAAKKYITFY